MVLFHKVTGEEGAVFLLSQMDRLNFECHGANERVEQCGPMTSADLSWWRQPRGSIGDTQLHLNPIKRGGGVAKASTWKHFRASKIERRSDGEAIKKSRATQSKKARS